MSAHEPLGGLVLCLSILRLAYRLIAALPAPVPMPAWMRRAAALTHILLCGLLAAIPLLGIFGAWFAGQVLKLYFLSVIDTPLPAAPVIGESLLELHKIADDTIIWLARLHVAAARLHQFVLRATVGSRDAGQLRRAAESQKRRA